MYYSIIATTIVVCSVLLFVVINLYRKNRVYEGWILDIRNSVNKLQEDIHEIDSQHLFEKDDDVGVVYEGITDLVEELNKKINEE